MYFAKFSAVGLNGTTSVSYTHLEKKQVILADAEKQVEGIMQKYQMGLLTNEERYQQTIKIWAKASSDVTDAMMEHLGAVSYTHLDVYKRQLHKSNKTVFNK